MNQVASGEAMSTKEPLTEVQKRFIYARPSQEGIDRIEVARAAFRELVKKLEEVLPSCRETALVWTKLEEASMWSNKALAFSLQYEPVDNGGQS